VGTVRHYYLDHDAQVTDSGTVPAGYAVEDIEVLVLDEHGNAVGYDTVGEIAVRSRYLALGYWRRPDLTREKFFPDPHGSDARLYLTGDVGRMAADGGIIHLGRKDFQVKVSGHRVETMEVETALLDFSTIKQAFVTQWEDQSGERPLVAYIQMRTSNTSSPGAPSRPRIPWIPNTISRMS
jgi:non-ribosomal peptide synthetase component F